MSLRPRLESNEEGKLKNSGRFSCPMGLNVRSEIKKNPDSSRTFDWVLPLQQYLKASPEERSALRTFIVPKQQVSLYKQLFYASDDGKQYMLEGLESQIQETPPFSKSNHIVIWMYSDGESPLWEHFCVNASGLDLRAQRPGYAFLPNAQVQPGTKKATHLQNIELLGTLYLDSGSVVNLDGANIPSLVIPTLSNPIIQFRPDAPPQIGKLDAAKYYQKLLGDYVGSMK